MYAKNSFADTNVEPKFELSDDPEHMIDVYEVRKLTGFFDAPLRDQRPLRRIRALRDFGDVKKGDLGGYLQDPSFLDHSGDCWIYDNACVLTWSVPIINRRSDNILPKLDRRRTFLTGNARLYDHVLFSGGVIDDQSVVRGHVHCLNVHL